MRLFATLGIILCIPRMLQAQGAGTGSVEGTVADSIHLRPLAGGRVQAIRMDVQDDSEFVAITDVRGRFRFAGLHPGRYALALASPLLDSLEYGAPATQVSVVARQVAHVELGIPSGRTLRAVACPGADLPLRTGALLGHTSDADTDRPLAGASVLVAWSELDIDSVTHVPTSGERLARTIADSLGAFRLCGVPTGEWLVVQVQHANRAGSVLRLTIDDAVGVLVRNLTFSVAGSQPLVAAAAGSSSNPTAPAAFVGTASVTGIVRRDAGRPVAGAQVRMVAGGSVVRTDDSGRFLLSTLPAGTHDIEVKLLGYRVERRAVDLRSGVAAFGGCDATGVQGMPGEFRVQARLGEICAEVADFALRIFKLGIELDHVEAPLFKMSLHLVPFRDPAFIAVQSLREAGDFAGLLADACLKCGRALLELRLERITIANDAFYLLLGRHE